MDDLQVPRDSICGHIEIPLYCSENYDKGTFLEYPDRLRWTRDEITNTGTTGRTLDPCSSAELVLLWDYA
jgi:hypothetical protein